MVVKTEQGGYEELGLDNLIPKNVALPFTSSVKVYSPSKEDQKTLLVDVISGEHPLPFGPYHFAFNFDMEGGGGG